MDDAKKAVLMFVSENYEQALQYAEMLHSDNTDRKELIAILRMRLWHS